ncbi:6193_t:CDS:2 [Ambispora leptoticha]|uniref:6193_t:CDS:1 n=1 Tax=Ambispora leptoticha TaxID=144679 RepID=A0A9N8VRC5_9GLOM|nr:6193_t:CDS:2 [Ambispora leptoticha]
MNEDNEVIEEENAGYYFNPDQQEGWYNYARLQTLNSSEEEDNFDKHQEAASFSSQIAPGFIRKMDKSKFEVRFPLTKQRSGHNEVIEKKEGNPTFPFSKEIAICSNW